jgi:hypothetical protein
LVAEPLRGDRNPNPRLAKLFRILVRTEGLSSSRRRNGVLIRAFHETPWNGSRLMERRKIPFESPVSIRAGDDSTVRNVKSVNGASEVLTDWPHARRGPVYQETVAMIEAALAGSEPAAKARAAFEAFAIHAGVLVRDRGDAR